MLRASEDPVALRAPNPGDDRTVCAPYSTVMENDAVCCMLPDVAVTVTVDVTGLVVVVVDDPPQPENRAKPATLTASSKRSCSRLRFLKPRKQSAIANVAAGKNGPDLRFIADVVEDGLTERDVVEAEPCGTMIGFGLKVQV